VKCRWRETLMKASSRLFENAKRMAFENTFISEVISFGSAARGESDRRSDLDILILWEGLNMDWRERYVHLYKVASSYFTSSGDLTVLDMEYGKFLKPRKITTLLLNIIWDGLVLYDRHGKLKRFLSKVRRELREKGIVRVKSDKYYYWVLPKPGVKVELKI
jgi:predicted nucleotidyltransferase